MNYDCYSHVVELKKTSTQETIFIVETKRGILNCPLTLNNIIENIQHVDITILNTPRYRQRNRPSTA